MALYLMVESFPRELERILDSPLSAVQRALISLEKDGLVAGRSVGRTRVFKLDPRYFAARDLQRYLGRLVEPEGDLNKRIARLRRRPRRTSKAL